MRLALATGTSCTFTPIFCAISLATSMSRPCNCRSALTEPKGAKSCGTAMRTVPAFWMSANASARAVLTANDSKARETARAGFANFMETP